MATLILMTLFLMYAKTFCEDQWIDPHEMKPDILVRNYNSKSIHDKQHTGVCLINATEAILLNSAYLKRITNMLLSVVDINENGKYSGRIELEISSEDYSFLKKIVNENELNHDILRKLTSRIDNSFKKGVCNGFSYTANYFFLWNLVNNSPVLVFMIISVIFYMGTKYLPIILTVRNVFILFLLACYLADFIIRYLSMIEDEEINKYLEMKAKEENICHPDKITIFLSITDALFGVCSMDEKKFYQSQKNVILLVTPLKVIGSQLDFLSTALAKFGKGIGYFMFGALEDRPFLEKIIFLPFMCTLALVVVLLCCSSFLNVSSYINFFYLLPLSIGSNYNRAEILKKEPQNVNHVHYIKYKLKKPRQNVTGSKITHKKKLK